MRIPVTSPHDNVWSANTRFLIELTAWIAAPWAVYSISGSWSAAIVVLVILLALPAVFSVRGDKKRVLVAIPGLFRLIIEAFLMVAAIWGVSVLFPLFMAAVVTLVSVNIVTGARRIYWLLTGR